MGAARRCRRDKRRTALLHYRAMALIEEIPEPRRRYFDEHPAHKRRVTVKISYFHGTGSHFHVEMTEEHNYLYDSRGGEWIAPADDPDGEGRVRFMKFRTDRAARRWVAEVFASEFSSESLELYFSGDVEAHWFYPEGG